MRIKKQTLKCMLSVILTLAMIFSTVLCSTVQISAEDATEEAETSVALAAEVVETAVETETEETQEPTEELEIATEEEKEVAVLGAGEVVYFRNTANWSAPKAYMWKDGNGDNGGWPGQAMTQHKDNVWKYTVPGDYNMIIFNDGNGTQTSDLSFAGNGKIYDYSTGSWSDYEDHKDDPTQPTTAPTTAPTVTPTNPTPSEGKMVYVENAANWQSVSCYMWKDGSGDNGGWPGKAMTNIYDNIWQYEVTGNFNMIIFNNGSDAAKTGDMSFPGAGYIYNNQTNEWKIFDTSPITVKSFGANLAAPQYKGTEIELTTTATSTGGAVSYKFTATNGGNTTVLSDYSSKSKVVWTPTAAGTYTLKCEYKDTAGNTNERTLSYVISDDSNVVEPILKSVSPKAGQIKKGTAVNFKATASGGKTGTNLLFYKFTIKDSVGNIVNVPYYTKNNTYKFTLSALGEYEVTVSVQNSDNDIIERTFVYNSVNEVVEETEPSTEPSTQPSTSKPQPTEPTTQTSLKGDANNDGLVTVLDATAVQRYVAKLTTDINLANAETDGKSGISVVDATLIQRYIAKLETNW